METIVVTKQITKMIVFVYWDKNSLVIKVRNKNRSSGEEVEAN